MIQRLVVSDLMRDCCGAIVCEDTRLRDAAEILITNNLTVLIATDVSGQLAGVVPETAVIRKLLTTPSRTVTISEILSRHVECTLPQTSLYSVLHLFRSVCHCVIPVVDENRQIVGLLHRQDVVRLLLSEMDGASESGQPSTAEPHFLKTQKARLNQPDQS